MLARARNVALYQYGDKMSPFYVGGSIDFKGVFVAGGRGVSRFLVEGDRFSKPDEVTLSRQ